MNFSHNLQKLKDVHNLKNQDIANICGVSEGAVRSWLGNSKTPSVVAVSKLAVHFNISMDELCGIKIKKPATDDGSEAISEDSLVISLLHQVPKDKRPFVLKMIRAALEAQGLI